jgi:hypothetical protein
MIYTIKLYLRLFGFLIKHPKSVRVLPQWLKFYVKRKKANTISLGLPWMNFEITKWLQNRITPEMKVFEWGSGGSTIFYASLAQKVVSIEYDKGFYAFIKDQLDKSRFKNIDLRLIPSEDNGTLQCHAPGYEGRFFDNYVNSICTFQPATFDLIIVDGRQRNACFIKAMELIKPGGIIVFDNTEREFYQKSMKRAIDFEMYTFKGLLPCTLKIGTTSVFIKK